MALCFQKNNGKVLGCNKTITELSSYKRNPNISELNVKNGIIYIRFNLNDYNNSPYEITLTPDILNGVFIKYNESGNACDHPAIKCKNKV